MSFCVLFFCLCMCVYVYLHPSLHKAHWQACQCGDVGSIAGLADPFLQLVEKHQLISIHCCLQSLTHTNTNHILTKSTCTDVTHISDGASLANWSFGSYCCQHYSAAQTCFAYCAVSIPEETAGQRRGGGPAAANCGSW